MSMKRILRNCRNGTVRWKKKSTKRAAIRQLTT